MLSNFLPNQFFYTKHPIGSTVVIILSEALLSIFFPSVWWFLLFCPSSLIDNIMNLTINHLSKGHSPQSAQVDTPTLFHNDTPASSQCPGFFSTCMAPQYSNHQHDYSREEVWNPLQETPSRSPKYRLEEEPQRRTGISLSLSRKRSTQFTPDKQNNLHQSRPNSESKKMKTEQPNLNGSWVVNRMEQHGKLRTEPKKESRVDEGSHKLKESRKPSTQVGSANSAKKSNDSGKGKLTLSNAFRSQMQHCPIAQSPVHSHPLPTASQAPPSSLLIEESFMTAKLANIYGSNSTELELFPNSNIVYYNQIMTNEKAWKGEARHEPPRGEISIQSIPNDPAEADPAESPQLQEQEAFYAKLKERRWIGEFAKTIKTFNQSELRSNQFPSETESIVLERGCGQLNFRPFVPLNHGSIKEWRQDGSDRFKREYDSGALSVSHDNPFRKLGSPPIEQDLHDSDHLWERE